jgi:hypothetical protein
MYRQNNSVKMRQDLLLKKLEKTMTPTQQTELEAAAFRRLVSHLQTHTEVQNIDLMITADFCRNCLAKWLTVAAQEQSLELDYEQAREMVYGMPYGEWKDKFQTEATSEKLAAYAAKKSQEL